MLQKEKNDWTKTINIESLTRSENTAKLKIRFFKEVRAKNLFNGEKVPRTELDPVLYYTSTQY